MRRLIIKGLQMQACMYHNKNTIGVDGHGKPAKAMADKMSGSSQQQCTTFFLEG